MSSTEAENKEIARRIAEEAWDEGKLELIDEYFAEEFVSHDPVGPDGIHGPEEYKEQITMFRSIFPDIDVTVEDSIAEGDKVVQRLSQTGTHEGAFMAVEPTGRKVTSSGIIIGRLEDGEVVEEWAQLDQMGLMQQLGVVEPPGE